MGDLKDVHSKLQELSSYFGFWNTLAFGDLPFVIGFEQVVQIYNFYYHVTDLSNKPRRVEIGELLKLDNPSNTTGPIDPKLRLLFGNFGIKS
uniref:Uncharacterized protein n=1 Tax=Rhizophagus irregularis (strain DAOM 181602 / DAOM 197198 / MUCL 43194) TaxID=747089 RepID=U9SQR1_RHIID